MRGKTEAVGFRGGDEMSVVAYSDTDLEKRISRMQADVMAWAENHDIWYDSGFTTYAKRVGAEPGQEAVIFVLYSSGPLAQMLDGDLDPPLRAQLDQIADRHGFWYENYDGVSYYFFATTEELQTAYDAYFHWKWVCSLIVEDFGDLYGELYQYFHARPERLQNLHHRDFEIFLHRLFQSQGYESELGPGVGDGGVDVRLLQRGPLGDTLAYVQAKRYSPSNPIGLEAVAALRGVVANDGVDCGIFVTTSRYLPSAEAFARRSSGVLELKTSNDVAQWCKDAEGGVIKDKSTLISDTHILSVLRKVERGQHVSVLHARSGYSTIGNVFALVLKETRHAALLLILPKVNVGGALGALEGHEVPTLDDRVLGFKNSHTVFRAKRRIDDHGAVSYWDGRNLFHVWDRRPCHFSLLD